MAVLTIRNLDEAVKQGLRLQAAKHGHSMEEEARRILRRVILGEGSSKGLGTLIHTKFKAAGGFDMPEIERSEPRSPNLFGEKE